MMTEAHSETPAGWKLTIPVVNLPGGARTPGAWVAAIADKVTARQSIPYGRAVPSAPLAPLTAADLERYGVAPGETKKIV